MMATRLDICMLDPLFYPYQGGTEKHVLEVGKRLAKKHNVSVLTSQLPNAKAKKATFFGINIIRTPAIYLENLPSFMPPPYTICPFFVRDLLKQRNADLFHIHNRFWYYPDTLGAIQMKLKKPLFLTLHNAKPEGISPLTDIGGALYDSLLGERVMEAANRMMAVSRYTKEVTVPKKFQYKCDVVHNGVDEKLFNPHVDSSFARKKLGISNEPLILTNARLVKQKGLKHLLDGFAIVRQKEKDAQLAIIGKGNLLEELERYAKKLKVREAVHFVSGIPEKELPFYYRAADVFVLPSLWEPCAVVLFEALATGTPIVATNVGGNTEIVNHSCARIIPPKDPIAIAKNVLLLLSDDKLRRKLGAEGRKRVVENFTWDHTAKKVEAIYKKTLDDL